MFQLTLLLTLTLGYMRGGGRREVAGKRPHGDELGYKERVAGWDST